MPRALVRISLRDGKYFGRINVSLRDGEYGGGDILDPDTGSVYRCKFHLEHDGTELVVRGFIGISLLGRSQAWHRQG